MPRQHHCYNIQHFRENGFQQAGIVDRNTTWTETRRQRGDAIMATVLCNGRLTRNSKGGQGKECVGKLFPRNDTQKKYGHNWSLKWKAEQVI